MGSPASWIAINIQIVSFNLENDGPFNVMINLLLLNLYLVIIMVVYSVFVFRFYKLIAKKNIFELNLYQYSKAKHKGLKKSLEIIFYILEYAIIFPIISLVWVSIISALLFFMSEDPFGLIVLGAVAVVVTIRATSYFSEELSTEIAKLLPFGLLALALTKISTFAFLNYPELINQLPDLWKNGVYFIVFILAFEVILRILYSLNIFYPDAKG